MQSWYLEGYFTGDGFIHRQPVQDFPFFLGREEHLSLSIFANSISRRHALIESDGCSLIITDMGSKNGTFVNHNRIASPTLLQHGDIVHLGDVEMRLMQANQSQDEDPGQSTVMITPDLTNKFPYGAKELVQIIEDQLITTAFQSIVYSRGGDKFGYEILGRGTSDLLPKSPVSLFGVAESVGLEVQLSELMRDKGVEIANSLGLVGQLFVNTHPAELQSPDRLLASVVNLHKRFPQANIMLEIHEQAITDLVAIKYIKDELNKLSIQIAYDDFGVGQSRLLELVEAAPEVLKFDMMLTRDIDTAEPAKLELVQQLHQLARKLNIHTLAECVSRNEEYEICKTIGFDFYQGYLFDEPKYPAEFAVKS